MKGISNLIAVLIIIGITIALAIFVSSMVLTQITRSAQQPKHLQVVSLEVISLSSNAFRAKVTLYNPTNLEFTVCPTSVSVYMVGFRQSVSLTVSDGDCIRLMPGETGKLEVIARSVAVPIRNGVLAVSFQASTAGGTYQDQVLIPLK